MRTINEEENPAFTREQLDYMSPNNKPIGRLNKRQAAFVLGMEPHDIRILVSAGLLLPLGSNSAGCVQYFATVDIQAKAENKVWLAKATRAIQEHWLNYNRRGGGNGNGSAEKSSE